MIFAEIMIANVGDAAGYDVIQLYTRRATSNSLVS